MLESIDLTNVLVLDIETVSEHKTYEDQPPVMQKLWDIKADQIQRRLAEEDRLPSDEAYVENAGIYSEFGKIVCISVGIFRQEKDGLKLNLKSYYGDDEVKLLTEFAEMLDKFFPDKQFTEKYFKQEQMKYMCGHNIKEFDLPYICRRMVIKGLPLPKSLEMNGKKPWELTHLLDTMDQWKFGDYKAYTSLKLLCGIFEVPTPKDDIDGSEVGKTFWKEGNVDRIEAYCKKDVLATARVLMKFKLMDYIQDDAVIDRDAE